MTYVIGVDESGTGAWAGPFMVGAVVCEVLTFNRTIGRDLNDSKKLSDSRRRALVPKIEEAAVASCVVTVPVERIAEDHRGAWRWGVWQAIKVVRRYVNRDCDYTVIIDGPVDGKLARTLRKKLKLKGDALRFEEKADGRFPAVMGASILAKTHRNDAMIALDAEFPEFLWAKNAGYGVPAHMEACRKYGLTEHHRPIRTLEGLSSYTPRADWYEVG